MNESTQGPAPMPHEHILAVETFDAGARAHLFPDVATMAIELRVTHPDDAIKRKLEFFDSRGSRLALGFGADGRELVLQQTDETPDPARALAYLREMADAVERFIRTHPELLEKAKMTEEQALARLPKLLDNVSLPEAFKLSVGSLGHQPLGPGTPQDPGDPFHIIWVHGLGG